MKIFTASFATETNTFSPIYAGLQNFYDSFYAPPGEHPPTPTLCSAPFVALRERAASEKWEIAEGTATWAEPAGLLSRSAYETLRDEILEQLRTAMPVDAAVFGLHGAMVADGYDDCEGDFLARARQITGDNAVIAASFDPHSHFSDKRREALNFAVAFKEFPHTDFMARARDLTDILARQLRGEILPQISVFDCRMIDVMPTTAEPMRSFVRRIKTLEQTDGKVLSVSVIHGFLAGDVPDLGAKIIVITDNDKERGDALAKELGMELFALRGKVRMTDYSTDTAIDMALAATRKPAVIADIWDNPGGGVAGDSTVLLRRLLERQVRRAAVATIWDAGAVEICFAAGSGAVIDLRLGGKSGPGVGEPLDVRAEILSLHENLAQGFGESIVYLGKTAALRATLPGAPDASVTVLANTIRAQTFSPDAFANAGIAPKKMDVLVVKSTNHFYQAFAPIAGKIIYADSGTPYPRDPKKTQYKKLTRAIWPICENPHDE